MFEYLTGLVTEIKPDYLVLEVNSIGYRLILANPYQYKLDQSSKIYVEQIIRENEQVLYGFRNHDEKALFDRLTSVSGIGPKSAIAILAMDDHQGLVSAISQGDVKFLTSFPGIGKKTAQQIILDLKDKIGGLVDPSTVTSMKKDSPITNVALSDGLAALAALGYSERDLNRITDKLTQLEVITADGYVRAGLKMLNK